MKIYLNKTLTKIWNWIKSVFKATKKPDNVANGILLALVLIILITAFKPVFYNRAYARVDSYNRAIFANSTSNKTLYFVISNTGNVPLEIIRLEYMWTSHTTGAQQNPRPEWHKENPILLDDFEQEAILSILQPNEKIKVHTTIQKPDNLNSDLQLIQLCVMFKPTEKVYFRIFKKGGGICNPYINLYWE